MKLFEVRTDMTSLAYPIVKIIICLSAIVFSIFRNRIFQFSNTWLNTIVALLCFVLGMASILCLYISVGEVFHTIANRKNANHQFSEMKWMTIGTITKIVSENDIVEIDVCKDKKLVKVGVSADCEYASSVFKNKLFYISSAEYESIEQFEKALLGWFPKGSVPVLKIDGLPLSAFGYLYSDSYSRGERDN